VGDKLEITNIGGRVIDTADFQETTSVPSGLTQSPHQLLHETRLAQHNYVGAAAWTIDSLCWGVGDVHYLLGAVAAPDGVGVLTSRYGEKVTTTHLTEPHIHTAADTWGWSSGA
jgi:hypothetical protein